MKKHQQKNRGYIMPLPKPFEDESESDFIQRCIIDETMVEEFEESQRIAICYTIFEINEKQIQNELQEFLLDLKQTNFPFAGEDKEVSLRNSQYPLINLEFAENIKNNYPKVWNLGGNILGNQQYNILKTIRDENLSGDKLTRRQEEAIRLREAWIARHIKDFRINGVIAQIKWHAIGEQGFENMRKLVNEEIEKRGGRNGD
jgi:hypothetical protein